MPVHNLSINEKKYYCKNKISFIKYLAIQPLKQLKIISSFRTFSDTSSQGRLMMLVTSINTNVQCSVTTTKFTTTTTKAISKEESLF